ncbi:MAG: 30S ribosomal protein S16 [Bacteroidota bacterium]
MSVKIRLQRLGRKKAPYYHIVVADSRAPRDGKFIENIGYYKPQTVPATIELDANKALSWLEKGAQPTDTCRAILSYKGVLYQHHLNVGVKKGAMTAEQATEKFEKWMSSKSTKVDAHVEKFKKTVSEKKAEALAAETKVKEARAVRLAEKLKAEEDAKVAAAIAESAPHVEEGTIVADTSAEIPSDAASETPAE